MPRNRKKHRKKNRKKRVTGRVPEHSGTPLPKSAGPTGATTDEWVRLTLTADLLEDAHLGTGSGGGGGIDALVARDRRWRPVIWASHLEGILRDVARRLHGDNLADDFFGRSGGQRRRALFTSLYTVEQTCTRIWRSAARASFDNRAPKDDTLRVVEYVPLGTRFEGQVEIRKTDLPALRRLLLEIDAIGAGRATGAGRVKLSLSESTFNSRNLTGDPTERLVILLRNLDPLCITSKGSLDNLIPSLPFVPGRTLLGALTAWLIDQGDRNTAALLVGGMISVGDALPVPDSPGNLTEAEVLPAPLSLLREKPPGAGGSIPWWAGEHVVVRRFDAAEKPEDGLAKRPEADLFVYRHCSGESWVTYRPERRYRLRSGRPDPDQPDPSLFAIEAVVEDTRFLCELVGDTASMKQLTNALKPVLEGRRWLRIGRGGAPVEIERMAWAEHQTEFEVSTPAYLVLTSDLMARDEMLRWCTALDDGQFRKFSGWPNDVHISPVIQDSVAIHGFNGTSRLPRMPAFAVRRGSVFRVEGVGIKELARMAAAGRWLGERTHEGFGRFRLDVDLPGIMTDVPIPMRRGGRATAKTSVTDAPEEKIAETTKRWLDEHRELGSTKMTSDRRPSLSQWFDLVSELEARKPDALTSRLNPKTAGGRAWKHPKAVEVLQMLKECPTQEQQTRHARMFVRWLRAEMRGVRA